MQAIQAVKTACTRLREIREDFWFSWYAEGQYAHEERVSLARFCWWYFADCFRQTVVCSLLGHRWEEDEGYCGPETGSMGCRCTRCGETHHVTLY